SRVLRRSRSRGGLTRRTSRKFSRRVVRRSVCVISVVRRILVHWRCRVLLRTRSTARGVLPKCGERLPSVNRSLCLTANVPRGRREFARARRKGRATRAGGFRSRHEASTHELRMLRG